MKLSKRMLAVLCTLLMLASCFALPYGAMAAEEAEMPTSEFGQVVGVIQQDEVTTTVNGGDFIGRDFNDMSPTIPLTKAGGNYAIVLEIKVHQDYGFKNADWMQASLGDGGTTIYPTDGASFSPGHLITKWLPQNGRANDTWMKVAISLNGYTGDDIKSVQFGVYNHPERYDSKLTSDDRLHGASISYRNVYVVDMSRTSAGGPNKNVVSFGLPEQEFTKIIPDGEHTTTLIDLNGALYNLATSDMDLSKLTLEFDMKYTSTNPDFDASQIKDGRIRMGGGETKSNWSNDKTPMKDTWYHITVPLTDFNANLTDASAINSINAFNYNNFSKDGTQTNPGFTAYAKNIVITHNDVTALEKALEAAKTFVYDVDGNEEDYETALNNARAPFSDSTATYANFATALTALNTAKANVTNGRDMVYEVAHFQAKEYTKTEAQYANNGDFYYDWYPSDGFDPGIDLTDGTGDNKVGANRYMQMTVTLERNTTTYPIGTMDLLKDNVPYRLRSYVTSGEKRTDDYYMQIQSKEITDDKAVYQLEGVIDDSATNAIEWDKMYQSLIRPSLTVASDANKAPAAYITLSDVRIVNKTAEAIEAQLAECAAGTFPVGKYTAESMKSYLALKDEAQKLLDDDDATLQEKSQLIKKIDDAKAEFIPVITEYVQFGKPEKITSYSTTGGGKTTTLELTSNTLPTDADLSKLYLRVEVMAEREGDYTGVANALVNGNVSIKGGSVAMSKNYGDYSNSILGNVYSGEWVTRYYALTDLGCTSISDLDEITSVEIWGYNDLSKKSHNTIANQASDQTTATVHFRNVAIIDNTNVAAVDNLKAAFEDVTKGGTVDFTTESYAAYKAVYDEWYPVYAAVDLDQADEAIAAMADAYKLLVCVDKTVMTFSGLDGTPNANDRGFYADWKDSDQGLVDTSIRNHDNLVIRFDLSVTAEEGYTLPETLTTYSMRLGIRKQYGEEQSIEFQGNKVITSIDPTKVNHLEVPFTAKTGSSNTDGLLKSLILWWNFSELSDDSAAENYAGGYTFTLANVRVVDVTKENMVADLKAEAETTIADMEAANGCAYDVDSTAAYVDACNAALALVNTEDPRYADLTAAQKAIDDAKAELVAVGHIVMTFDGANGTSTGDNNLSRSATVTATDLTKFNADNLVLRFNLRLTSESGSINPPADTSVYMKNSYIWLKGKDANSTKTESALREQTYYLGDTVLEIPLKDMTGNLNLTCVNEISISGYIKEKKGNESETKAISQKYTLTVDNACIVDTTAEMNLGSKVNDEDKVESTVKTVGNGRIEITGGYLYGRDDTLTATTSSANSTFVGWKKNDTFVPANGDKDELTLPVNGKQNITAYFAATDETVVVYTSKYGRVIKENGVQVVKDANDLKTPTVPSITGYTFAGWNAEGENLAAAVDGAKGGSLIVEAIYEADEVTEANGYTVALSGTSNDDATAGKPYGFDQSIKVTAAAPAEGQKFSHWLVNGSVAGYTDTLTVYVSGTMTIEAFYVAKDVVIEQELSASITQNQMVENGSAYNFEIIAQTYLPDDYELMAYGVIFAPKEKTLTELKTDGATEGATLDVVSSSNIENRQYKITLENVVATRTRSAMAYIIARAADGTIKTAYSAPVTMTAGAVAE